MKTGVIESNMLDGVLTPLWLSLKVAFWATLAAGILGMAVGAWLARPAAVAVRT